MLSTKAQITCSKCGAQVPVNRMYCDECGAQLEHDINEVQASVDRENRLEKAKRIASTIRWFFAAGFVLTVGGCYFRRAYRELPENDVVAYATAPTVPIEDETSVGTLDFLVPLPDPKSVPRPPAVEDDDIDAKLVDEALGRTLVSLHKRGASSAVNVLLVGDTVFFVPVAGRKEPVQVHLADVRRMRPLGQGRWEIEARGLDEPAQITFETPGRVLIKALERRPDDSDTIHTVPLDQIRDIKPR